MARWKSSTLGWFLISLDLLSVLRLTLVSALRLRPLPLEIPEVFHEELRQAAALRLSQQRVGIYRNQIKCQGDLPYPFFEFPSSVLRGFSPVEAYPDVLSLCAATNIGGNPYWNADAYCGWKLDPPTVLISYFADVDSATSTLLIFWSKVVVFCQSRCFCLQDVGSPIIPNPAIPAPEVVESRSDPNGRIIRNPPRPDYGRHLASTDVKPIKVYIFWSYGHNHPRVPLDLRIFPFFPGLDIDAPRCDGPMPPVAFPSPFTDYPFPSLQSLCASLHFGGDSTGNLGGMCTKSLGHLIFAALYVHPGFSRYGDMNAFAIQSWCITHCACGDKDPETEYEMISADGIIGIYEPDFTNGGLIMRSKSGDGSLQDWTVLPPNDGGPSSSNNQRLQCNLNSASRCNPGSYLTSAELSYLQNFRTGPSSPLRIVGRPQEVRVLPFDQTPVQTHEDPTLRTCGGICSNFKDCASSLSEDCRCVVDVSHEDAQANGLAAVFTQSLCLPLAIASMTLPSKWSRLGGRSVDFDFACLCNQTFASRSCCNNLEGLVDEIGPEARNILYSR